jgi:ribosome-associated translation inhibitor RaiA
MVVDTFSQENVVLHRTEFVAANISRQLRAYAESRITQALAAFDGRYDLVRLTVDSDRSGAVTCQVRVRLVPSGIWLIQECHDANPYAAIERAAEAIARSFARQLMRIDAPSPTAA